MKKTLLAVSTLIFALTFPAISLSGEDHHGKMHGHGKRHSGYAHMVLSKAEKLELSNAQLGSIMRLHLEHQKVRKNLMKKIHNSMAEARKRLMNPTAEEETIRAAARKHMDAFNELVENALKERNEVNSVLQKEQKDKLASVQESYKGQEDDDDNEEE